MMPAKQLGAAVGRAVVHDEKIHLRAFRAQIFYRIDDVILLIVARDDNKNFFIQRGVPLNRIVVTSLGPLCEGDSPLRGEMSRSDRGARARRLRPQAVGREPCGYPKHFGPWQGSLPSALRGHLPPRGRQGENRRAICKRKRRDGFHIRPGNLPLLHTAAGEQCSPLQLGSAQTPLTVNSSSRFSSSARR